MAKKKNVPTANVREDRAPAAVSETPISTYFDIQPKSTPGSPKGVAGATWVGAPGGGFTLVKNSTPSIPKGVVGAEWVLNPPELGKAGTVTEETFGYKLFQPTPTSTPAMPKGVAGATWVKTPSGGFELKPDTGKPDDKFVPADGGLTPSSMITPEPAGYAIARRKLAEYGITGIDAALKKIREDYPELPTDDIIFLLENDKRYNAPFEKRFAANIGREKKGLPRLSAADYIAMEQGYKKIFSVYNLPTFANQAQYDKLIENDVDVDDTTDRVVMAYDRVLSDTNTRAAFSKFYSNITDSDIVSALLDPQTQIPVLEKKVMAAEIGGQALKQGLATSLVEQKAMVTPEGKQVSGYENVQRGTLGSQALTAQGVTEGLAATGYEEIASRLPEAEKLSSIYAKRAEQYGQKEAEQESLLKMASAQRKREKLTAMEEATFSGEAGTMRTSLGRRGRGGAF